MLQSATQSLNDNQPVKAAQSSSSTTDWQPLFIADPTTHCMGPTLHNYVLTKIDPDIKGRSWSQIIVTGHYTRTAPARISPAEKRDKPFNWQRPTSTITDATTIQINCFPGRDYVKHYAYLIATYLSLVGRNPSIVRYHLPEPSTSLRLLLESNIQQMGNTDIVIIGYVHQLKRFLRGTWERGRDGEDGLFAWQKFQVTAGHSVALLGCVASFWGDLSGHLVRVLQRLNNTRCVLYIGKTGSLRPQDRPNEVLATGNNSFIDDQSVSWNNVFEPYITLSSKICQGNHVTLCSALLEDQTWLKRWQNYSWVDSEIGYMAQASNEGCTEFGYLHVVSDNLARWYPHDLSNERLEDALLSRRKLLIEVENILEALFLTWTYEKT